MEKPFPLPFPIPHPLPFFGTRAELPSFLPLICIIFFCRSPRMVLRKEGRPLLLLPTGLWERDCRSRYCVGGGCLKARLLSMNHLISRVLQSSTNHRAKTSAQLIFTYCSSNLIELSVKFAFLSLRFRQRCFQSFIH